MRKLKGFTLIELLIVVAIIAILAAIAVPNFLEAQVRSKVSRVKADHRSMATAVETYYLDNNLYPAMLGGTSVAAGAGRQSADSITPLGTTGIRTFRLRDSSGLSTLTTPIAYITSYFGDPFADTRGLTCRYFTDRSGFILGSWGPDADQAVGGDLGWNDGNLITTPTRDGIVETVYDSRLAQPSTTLVAGSTATTGRGAFTYDPTNGTVSQGDVWRTKD
jgi:prepilin-type N-terminal cleavage/methylation domain-containing protein